MRPQAVPPAGAFIFLLNGPVVPVVRSTVPVVPGTVVCLRFAKATDYPYTGATEDRWMPPRKRWPKVPYGHPAQVTVSSDR